MPKTVIASSKEAAGEYVARAIADLIDQTPDAVLGLATGSSPLPVYSALAQLTAGDDLSRVRGFALDEYVGLDPAHPQSYRSVIAREVVQPLGLDPANVHVPPGDAADIETAGERYEAMIRAAGGVDVQLLGIGSNGHIAFNEPGSPLDSRTRRETLTERTRLDNARFFDSLDDVPRYCLTQGVGTILEAKRIFLLAFGEGKADAVRAALEGPVTSDCPASALQLHPDATFVLDEAAASGLS